MTGWRKKQIDNMIAGAEQMTDDKGYSIGTEEQYNAFVEKRNKSMMRARLREYEKQSGLEIFGLGAKTDKWEAALEKYAELIVRECIRQVDLDNGYGNNEWDRALTFVSKHLKEHFGVE